jgi:hypothetical protein
MGDPAHEAEAATATTSLKPIVSMAGWQGDRAMSRRGYGPGRVTGSPSAGLDAHLDAGK